MSAPIPNMGEVWRDRSGYTVRVIRVTDKHVTFMGVPLSIGHSATLAWWREWVEQNGAVRVERAA